MAPAADLVLQSPDRRVHTLLNDLHLKFVLTHTQANINEESHIRRYPESAIRHTQRNVRAVLDKQDLGIGTLFISESTLCWQEKDNVGFSISYPEISLHAISKDVNVNPKECIYIITDGHISMPGHHSLPAENDDSDDDSQPDLSEILLIPEDDSGTIQTIYDALKVCQELNPDPNDLDDDDDDKLYMDAEDDMDEGHYHLHESPDHRGGGDADIDDLSQRMRGNSVDIRYSNGNNDEDEFEDAD